MLPLVYDELRRLAAHVLQRETPGQTLQPTALVHEAYLRLAGHGQHWDNRSHFLAAAAEAMRRVLVESARRKKRLKRGGDATRLDLEHAEALLVGPAQVDILDLSEALDELAAEDGQKAELVKLRFFAGLSLEEAADCLGVSRPTVVRWWAYARAWLYDRLREKPGEGPEHHERETQSS
jgi:RNA polymerase sigma factor (TIGR02999 family)